MILKVAFNAPARRMFDYLPPESAAGRDVVGRRVLAPLRGRDTVGIVMESARRSEAPAAKLLRARKVFADMPALPRPALDLIRFCADYYCCPIGVAAFAAVPSPFRKNAEFKTARPSVVQSSPSPLSPAPDLTAEQQSALDAAVCGKGFAPHLIFGATGSGKTELYLRLIGQALAAEKQALILAPEIHLTPQLESALRGRFPRAGVCVLHSGLPDRERTQNWLSARDGSAGIILGTRLAVFAPAPRLGAVIVDEEHDESFREAEQGLLFSARDLGAWRARREGAAFFAGSATPSLESWQNAVCGKYKLLRLKKTVLPAARVSVELLRADRPRDGMTPAFMGALRESLSAADSQALVFINRRGYAPALVCAGCGTAAECGKCAAKMTAHKRGSELRCHWCGAVSRPPAECAVCGGDDFSPTGHGTQRVEEALSRAFPAAGVARLDRDSLARRGAFAAARAEIVSGARRILVGTQIIAKGHDFPRLNFIGVLNADAGLLSSDFRAQERMFALLTQTLGRGTRNPAGCRAVIQTGHPDHPFYAELRRGDVEACWGRLLAERCRSGLPPFSRLALLRAKSRDLSKLGKFLARARGYAPSVSGVRIYEPVPDMLSRVAGWHRSHILAQSRDRPALRRFLDEWARRVERGGKDAGIRWTMEVDPAGV